MVEYEVVKALADLLIAHDIGVAWPIAAEVDAEVLSVKPTAVAYLDARALEDSSAERVDATFDVQWIADTVSLDDVPRLASEIVRRFSRLGEIGPDADHWSEGAAGYYTYLVPLTDLDGLAQQFPNRDDGPGED